MTTKGLLVAVAVFLAYVVIIAGTWGALYLLAAAARAHFFLF